MKGLSLWCTLDPVHLAWWQLAFIAKDRQDLILSPRVLVYKAFERLEPCAGKLASTVLRGPGGRNAPRLPGRRRSSKQIKMEIIDLEIENLTAIQQAANLLVEGFRDHWPNAWPGFDSALHEIHEALKEEKINRIAVNHEGMVLGWIGGISEYNGNAWELHPLVVHPDHQRKGIGQALVADLEQQVKKRGGITIFLGTDDEDAMTSLSNKDLYPNLFEHIAEIHNLRGHPYEFYQKQGFTIVGVIPDANGFGKPDIMMAKRIG